MGAAGGVVFSGGRYFPGKEENGEIHASSPADGRVVEKVRIPTPPVLEGPAAAHGKVFVSLYDGTRLCLRKK